MALAVRLIAKEGIPLASNVWKYLQCVRDAMSDGSVPRWQAPALELLLRTRRATAVTLTFADSPPEDYLSSFGQVLGNIECETEYGPKKAVLGLVPRALLYAGASRAIALDDFTSGARALRCIHYVVADGRDRRHEEVLLDAICARQEPEGHFGPHDQILAEQLLRVFACLWAIAEVCSDYRLIRNMEFEDR